MYRHVQLHLQNSEGEKPRLPHMHVDRHVQLHLQKNEGEKPHCGGLNQQACTRNPCNHLTYTQPHCTTNTATNIIYISIRIQCQTTTSSQPPHAAAAMQPCSGHLH